ncbi:MAG: hypothetical protein KDD06_23770, partial [Phaeodactylibacter sp.]|nr:hypothetical protein [Phaeodactylibacter sp.]
MRKAILLLLSFSILTQLIAQPSNDNCSNALNLPLQTPSSCPESGELTDNFRFTNIGATPSDPFPALSGCSGEAPSSGADVWFQFNPAGNNITLTVSGGLDAPFAALFENGSEGCSGIYPVACASGAGSLELSVNVDPNNSYYLLISGGEVEDQGDFELSITTSNDCSPCVSGREGYFSVTPAPENGTYRSGQPVQMCYVVTRWDAGSGGEYLHGLELSFGPAWDQESFAPVPPPSCSGEGIWGYYDSWASSATGQDHGPGFAFDGPDFDGNPGNNLGESTIGCANIGTTAPPVSFCWTITADECITGESSIYGDLNISVRLLGDGVSGAGENTLCPDGRREDFLATLHCPDPLAPDVIAIDASCGGNCDGSLLITGGGEGPWNYTVTGPNGDVAYSSTGSTSTDTATALCPGLYTIDIFSLPAGENRRVTAGIGAPVVPVASANYTLPCVEGEPIELYGEAMPSQGASYSWSGPYGYSSSERDPLALYPGIYTLVVTVDGCPSAPFELEVPPISQTVASIAEDTLIACPGEPLTISASGNATSFTWYAGETATPIGTGPSITVNPEDGTVYRVAGTNDNGCTGFDEVLALVPFNPAITVDTSGILCPGTTLTLTATEGEQFLWSTGDSTASITASPEQSTLYSLEVTGPNGCVVQLSVFVSVANGAGIFISPDAAICEGESVSLFAGGGEVAWSTGDSVSTITVSPQQTTTYTAAITNSLGCVFSRETTVSVNPAPDIELLPSDTAYLCRGDSLQLSAFLSDTLIWDSLVAPAQTTYYPLPGAAGYGCQELAGFTVIVHPLPMVSIEGDELLCSSDSVLLVANGTGMLAWSTGENTDSIYVYPTGTETYSVTATDANGCSSTDSVQVTQAAPPEAPQVSCTTSLGQVVFTWIVEPGLTYGLSHLEGPAGIPSGNNRYVVNGLLPGQMVSIELEATNAAGCSAVTPASCSAPDCSVLSLFIGAPDEVCSDSGPVSLAAIATGGSGSGSGEWSGPGVDDTTDTFNPSLAGAGTHQLVYTYTDAGCTVSDTLQITVVQALEASMVTCDASPSTVVFSWPELPQDTAYEVAVLSGQNGSFTGPATYEVSGLSSGEEVTIEIRTLGAGACQTTSVTSTCYSAGCPVL